MLGIVLAITGVTPAATSPDLAVCVTVENPVRRAGAYCVLHLQLPHGSQFDHYAIQDGDALEYDALIAPSAHSWSETDLIERPLTNAPRVDPLHFAVGAWDIRTYRVTPKP
jgi:hypothetical protein